MKNTRFWKKLRKARLATPGWWFNQCQEVQTERSYCLKKVKDEKSFFDQSVLEIYILELLNSNARASEYNFLQMYDYFYFNVFLAEKFVYHDGVVGPFAIRRFYETTQLLVIGWTSENYERCFEMSGNFEKIRHYPLRFKTWKYFIPNRSIERG